MAITLQELVTSLRENALMLEQARGLEFSEDPVQVLPGVLDIAINLERLAAALLEVHA